MNRILETNNIPHVLNGLIDCHHPRLAIATILNAQPGAFVVLLGVVCGSWTVVNRGTSKRHICHPLGREDLEYVQNANCMISRCF